MVVSVEHRLELENLLLAGLPESERQQVIEAMREATATELRRKRALRDPNFHEPEAQPHENEN